LVMAAVALVAADGACSCERTQATLVALEGRFARLEKKYEALEQILAATDGRASNGQPGASSSEQTHKGRNDVVTVDSGGGARQGRRMTSVPTMLAATSQRSIHEFPAGHNCPNVGGGNGFVTLLPHTDSGASFDPTAQWSSADAEVSLSSVNDDWTTNLIDRFPAPLKIVHDLSCASPPTVELQLDTRVSGSLSVNGHAVAAGPRVVNSTVPALPATYPLTSTVTDAPGLLQTLELSAERTVLVHFQMSFELERSSGDYLYLSGSLWIDNDEKTISRSTTGVRANTNVAGFFGTCSGLWFGTLSAGSHQIKVRYRSGHAITFADNIQGTHGLQVLLL